jgi:hypothetical protein
MAVIGTVKKNLISSAFNGQGQAQGQGSSGSAGGPQAGNSTSATPATASATATSKSAAAGPGAGATGGASQSQNPAAPSPAPAQSQTKASTTKPGVLSYSSAATKATSSTGPSPANPPMSTSAGQAPVVTTKINTADLLSQSAHGRSPSLSAGPPPGFSRRESAPHSAHSLPAQGWAIEQQPEVSDLEFIQRMEAYLGNSECLTCLLFGCRKPFLIVGWSKMLKQSAPGDKNHSIHTASAS